MLDQVLSVLKWVAEITGSPKAHLVFAGFLPPFIFRGRCVNSLQISTLPRLLLSEVNGWGWKSTQITCYRDSESRLFWIGIIGHPTKVVLSFVRPWKSGFEVLSFCWKCGLSYCARFSSTVPRRNCVLIQAHVFREVGQLLKGTRVPNIRTELIFFVIRFSARWKCRKKKILGH